MSMVACNQQPADESAPEGEAVQTEEVTEAPSKPLTIKDVTPSKALVDSISYLVGIQFGSFIKSYNFGDLNEAQIKKGMNDFIKSQGNPRDPSFVEQFKINPETINIVFPEYLEKRQAYLGLKNKEAGEKFMAKNKKKAGVETTESGLQYKIVAPGNMDKVAGSADTVKVFYKGTLLDGTVFDQTQDDGEPAKFVVRQVIPGWQEGIKLVGEGGEIDLVIPAALAYGERGTQGIEPNSTLLFHVKVVEVLPYVEPVEENPVVVLSSNIKVAAGESLCSHFCFKG